jgi:DNA primase
MSKKQEGPAGTNHRAGFRKRTATRLFTSLSPVEVSQYYALCVPDLKQADYGEWRGPCPIHQGERDSFAVNPETGVWFCHSECGRGGSLFDLEMALTGVDFRTARKNVLQIMGAL